MRSIINEKNLKNKKILLRLDLNVPLEKDKITDTTRIDKILPTLHFLIKEKAKITKPLQQVKISDILTAHKKGNKNA